MLPGIPIREEQCIGDSLTVINEAFRLLDLRSAVPPGTIINFAGPTAPSGYLVADGSYVRVDVYTDLYQVLTNSGTNFRFGQNRVIEGLTHFKLPDYIAEPLPMEAPIVPQGTITMWSGLTIPDGWALCNGSNGTPDLRNRFIVGAGSDYEVGSTGGAREVTLTVSQIPPHTHSFAQRAIVEDAEEDDGDNFTVNGNNRQTETTGSAGGGQPHENRPPYYALAFIMRKSAVVNPDTQVSETNTSLTPCIKF